MVREISSLDFFFKICWDCLNIKCTYFSPTTKSLQPHAKPSFVFAFSRRRLRQAHCKYQRWLLNIMLQTSFSLQPVHLPRTYTPMCSQLCAYAHMICRHISISLKLHRSKVKFSCFWVAASEIHMHEHVCLCVYECVCLRLARRPQLP